MVAKEIQYRLPEGMGGQSAAERLSEHLDVERMGVHRNVVAEFAPRSRAARAYEDLWREVEVRLSLPG
jgi:hypothetical protein